MLIGSAESTSNAWYFRNIKQYPVIKDGVHLLEVSMLNFAAFDVQGQAIIVCDGTFTGREERNKYHGAVVCCCGCPIVVLVVLLKITSVVFMKSGFRSKI